MLRRNFKCKLTFCGTMLLYSYFCVHLFIQHRGVKLIPPPGMHQNCRGPCKLDPGMAVEKARTMTVGSVHLSLTAYPAAADMHPQYHFGGGPSPWIPGPLMNPMGHRACFCPDQALVKSKPYNLFLLWITRDILVLDRVWYLELGQCLLPD